MECFYNTRVRCLHSIIYRHTIPFNTVDKKGNTMSTITDPVIDQWYKDVENDFVFKVVAIEESDDMIEVQYYNGDIGEYDRDSWYGSTFDFIEAPEDWSAPYGNLELDDLGYSDSDGDNSQSNDTLLKDYED